MDSTDVESSALMKLMRDDLRLTSLSLSHGGNRKKDIHFFWGNSTSAGAESTPHSKSGTITLTATLEIKSSLEPGLEAALSNLIARELEWLSHSIQQSLLKRSCLGYQPLPATKETPPGPFAPTT
jgi:hypothetical protein